MIGSSPHGTVQLTITPLPLDVLQQVCVLPRAMLLSLSLFSSLTPFFLLPCLDTPPVCFYLRQIQRTSQAAVGLQGPAVSAPVPAPAAVMDAVNLLPRKITITRGDKGMGFNLGIACPWCGLK